MSAAELESAGEPVPADLDLHTTAGKLADFERRVEEATHAGSQRGRATKCRLRRTLGCDEGLKRILRFLLK